MKTMWMCLVVVSLTACVDDGDQWSGPGAGSGGGPGSSSSGGGDGGSGGSTTTSLCPSGATSPDLHGKLVVEGSGVVGGLLAGGFGVTHTVVGGTQELTLAVDSGGAEFPQPLDVPFTVAGDGTSFVVENVVGATVTVRALGGRGYIRAIDPTNNLPFGCQDLDSGTIASIIPQTVSELVFDQDKSVVYAAGAQDVGVGLVDADGERLVDTSMTLAADGGAPTSWQTIHFDAATAGTHAIALTGSNGAVGTLAAEVVDHATSVEALYAPTSVQVGVENFACWSALSDGRLIAGSAFAVTAGGTPAESTDWLGPNCFFFTPASPGTLALIATSGGATVEIDVPATSTAASRGVAERYP